MCLKVLMSILDFKSSESTEQYRPRRFQGPKTEIISSKIANLNFLGSEAKKLNSFCKAKYF